MLAFVRAEAFKIRPRRVALGGKRWATARLCLSGFVLRRGRFGSGRVGSRGCAHARGCQRVPARIPHRGEHTGIAYVHFPHRYGRSERKRWTEWRLLPAGGDYAALEHSSVKTRIAAVRQVDRCTSEFHLADFHYRGTSGGYLDPYDVALATTAPAVPYRIDWSEALSFATASPVRHNRAPTCLAIVSRSGVATGRT